MPMEKLETKFVLDDATVDDLFSPTSLNSAVNFKTSALKRVSLPLSTPVQESPSISLRDKNAKAQRKSYPRLIVSNKASPKKRQSLIQSNDEAANLNSTIGNALKVISDINKSSKTLVPLISKSSSSRDPEDILAENLRLKKSLNQLTAQKTQLTGRLRNLEEENRRIERRFESYLATTSVNGAGSNGSLSPSVATAGNAAQGLHLVSSLKQRLREKDLEIHQLQQEKEEMHQKTRFTKLNELENCLRIYSQENTQLTRELEFAREEKTQLAALVAANGSDAYKIKFEELEQKLQSARDDCSFLKMQEADRIHQQAKKHEVRAPKAAAKPENESKERLKRLQTKLDQQAKQIDALLQQNQQSQELTRNSEASTAKLAQELDLVQKELATTKDQKSKISQLKDEEYHTETVVLKASISKLEKQLASAESAAQQHKSQLDNLAAENARIQNVLSQTNLNLEKAQIKKEQASALEQLKKEKAEQEIAIYKKENESLLQALAKKTDQTARLEGELLAIRAEASDQEALKARVNKIGEEKRDLINQMNEQLEKAHLQTRRLEQMLELERSKKDSPTELQAAQQTIQTLEKTVRTASSERLEQHTKLELVNKRSVRLNERANSALPVQLQNLVQTHKDLDSLSREFLFNLTHLDKKAREKFLDGARDNFKDSLEKISTEWADNYHFLDQTIQDIRVGCNKLAATFDPTLANSSKTPEMSKSASLESFKTKDTQPAASSITSSKGPSRATSETPKKSKQLSPAAQAVSEFPNDFDLSTERKKKASAQNSTAELNASGASKLSKSKTSLNSNGKKSGSSWLLSKFFNKGSTNSLNATGTGAVGVFDSNPVLQKSKSQIETSTAPRDHTTVEAAQEELAFSHRKSPTISPIPNESIRVQTPISAVDKQDQKDCSSSFISKLSEMSDV